MYKGMKQIAVNQYMGNSIEEECLKYYTILLYTTLYCTIHTILII